MIKTQIDHAKSMRLKVLTLSVFANNERAHHVYHKVDFVDTGRIPKKFFKEGKYIGEKLMARVLEWAPAREHAGRIESQFKSSNSQ